MPTPTRVVTRFAPSPTGFLHIGGARTALFNWLHARHEKGAFLLRIEDTDRARSTPEATQAIFAGLQWLGLDWDGDAVSQFARAERHAEVARAMLERGTAYRCYATIEEIEAFRETARGEGRPPLFVSPWRDADPNTAPDAPFVIRLRAPRSGETRVEDRVQGHIAWKNETLDDLILLRSDGTPTYMLAVVVDDHDMGVTHVIRGDDHLTNAARQTLISEAMGWAVPVFAHIPLIHGPDGAKLSKRHGALGIEAYRAMGFLPEAMRNYLARLGWSHGNDEFFTTEQAVAWFDLGGIGRSPARFDLAKLENLSGQHIRATGDEALVAAVEEYLAAQNETPLTTLQRRQMLAAMPGLKERAKTIPQLLEMASFLRDSRPIGPDAAGAKLLASAPRGILSGLTSRLQHASWDSKNLEVVVRAYAAEESLGLGKVAQPLRVALSGRTVSPSVFDMMEILGREESLARIEDCARAVETTP
ncbi:MAG TPA: glutamate--tRNA ligase [Amaricoccus sp.]|mgnify:FL=1|uniref:glutamate--tRNA ligase n=1 Tax=Amaricoccus sp. TaxID=1872485 RepID=UPI002B93B24B|nr:glutamate--tRNA ligase [Amaricoccus sp.]HMQ91767.1 glutamate--tRNA ligase [Amaricoccus sp.]HMR51387.1 glutamate--tRNA ligase [Amaricoccus sp.]HMR60565.1 glutamate--tRNA ligase [Amaricoccus sp.]HMT98169.1 glutamate--tRNA ligase [Amaricoccus sp.]